MFSSITKGKIVAGLIALGIAGFFWRIFFPPGGSGANILLGLFVAIFFIHYFANYFGGLIDQEIFPGGSKERARLYRSLARFVEETKAHLATIKKSKSKRQKLGPKVLEDFQGELNHAHAVLATVKKDWHKESAMKEHERLLKDAYDRINRSSQQIFALDRNWRFLYGMPSLVIALLFALLLREFVIEPYQIPSGSMIPSLLVGDHLFVSKFYYGLSKPFAKDPKFMVQWRQPEPGDVVIFKAPDYVGRHAGEAWIKRVVAKGGQTIRLSQNIIYVDDQPYEHLTPEEVVTYMDYYGFGGPGGMWRQSQAKLTVEKIGAVEHPIYMPLFASAMRQTSYWPAEDVSRLPGLTCTGQVCRVKEGFVFVVGDNRANSHDSRFWGALEASRIKGRALFIWMSVDGSSQSVHIGPFSFPRFRFERWFTKIS
jgi:signal peptidase I